VVAGHDLAPTQSVFLALKEERAGMAQGYGFLDEKRLILASEMLAQLRFYEEEMRAFRQAYGQAARSLQDALARHGLEGLELAPQGSVPCEEMSVEARSVLGVTVQSPTWEADERQGRAPVREASPEAKACREAFLAIVPRAARLAVLTGNLERLRQEYARTARRARAVEEVLLPEIDDALRVVASALEELEREEALRVRQIPAGA
jgi:V/A-type H+-transporting ATPase subunit D